MLFALLFACDAAEDAAATPACVAHTDNTLVDDDNEKPVVYPLIRAEDSALESILAGLTDVSPIATVVSSW